MHTLFDHGYLTITPERRILVSKKIQEQYTNDKLYYSYHGQMLRSLPIDQSPQPANEYLHWHNENVFAA
jgi:putative restriction endonuclease